MRSGAGVGERSRGVLAILKPIRRGICCQLFSAGLTVLVSPRPNHSLCDVVQRCWVMLDLGRTQRTASQLVGLAVNATPTRNNLANHLLDRVFAVVGQQRGDLLLSTQVFGQRLVQGLRSDQGNRLAERARRSNVVTTDQAVDCIMKPVGPSTVSRKSGTGLLLLKFTGEGAGGVMVAAEALHLSCAGIDDVEERHAHGLNPVSR